MVEYFNEEMKMFAINTGNCARKGYLLDKNCISVNIIKWGGRMNNWILKQSKLFYQNIVLSVMASLEQVFSEFS